MAIDTRMRKNNLEKIAAPQMLAYVRSAIDSLENSAYVLIKEYEVYRNAINKTKKSHERSMLTPRLRKRRGTTSFIIIWKHTEFMRMKDGSSVPWSTEINKGRGTYIYRRTTLQKWAQPWELDEAYKLEQEFAKLRKEAFLVRRVWLAHGEYMRWKIAINQGAHARLTFAAMDNPVF